MTKIVLDKLQATKVGNIESVTMDKVLPQGALVSLGEADANSREIIKAVAPEADKEVLLVAAPEVQYDQKRVDELDYETPANHPVRAYHLTIGDKFQVEQSLFTATPAVGDVITADGATLGYKVAAGTEQTTFVVERLTKIYWDARPAVLLRVLTV
jgi:hypothetical protein